MTELILKGKIDNKKLYSIIEFLKSWDINAEIKTISVKKKQKSQEYNI